MKRERGAAMWNSIQHWPAWARVTVLAATLAAWVLGAYIAYTIGWLDERCWDYPANPVLDTPARHWCEHHPNPKLMLWGLVPPILVMAVVTLIVRVRG